MSSAYTFVMSWKILLTLFCKLWWDSEKWIYWCLGQSQGKTKFADVWGNLKFELITMKKKLFQLKQTLSQNKLKAKYAAIEWTL